MDEPPPDAEPPHKVSMLLKEQNLEVLIDTRAPDDETTATWLYCSEEHIKPDDLIMKLLEKMQT